MPTLNLKSLRVVLFASGFLWVSFNSAPARAHFRLVTPPSWAVQDSLGSPQKSPPCGQADPGNAAVPTGAVTTVQEGSTLTVTLDETVFHPGHYRVSLAADPGGLPADPPVTAGSTPCGSTTIDPHPTLPLLVDGVLVHTAAFGGQQSFQVQLPAGVTCTQCTLQVTEFMSQHANTGPGGCFYHHCATLSIAAVDAGARDAGSGGDAGSEDGGGSPPPGAGDGGPGTVEDGGQVTSDGGRSPIGPSTGCGCSSVDAVVPATLVALGAIGFLSARRRRAK